MKDNLKHKGYEGSVERDDVDNIYYGKILNINDLVSYHAANHRDLKTAFREAVVDYIETFKSLKH